MRKLDPSRLKTSESLSSDVLLFFSNTLYAANSSVSGILKLADSTSNTSATAAASANSVKVAYDLASNVSAQLASKADTNGPTFTGNTTIGNLVYSNTRITANGDVGTSGQVLTTGGPDGNVYWANVVAGSVLSDTNIISPFLLMGA